METRNVYSYSRLQRGIRKAETLIRFHREMYRVIRQVLSESSLKGDNVLLEAFCV